MDCSPPGSSVHGISQARILGWVAIPSPRDLPDPGIEPGSPALQADSLPSEPPRKPSVYKISFKYHTLIDKHCKMCESSEGNTFCKYILKMIYFLKTFEVSDH